RFASKTGDGVAQPGEHGIGPPEPGAVGIDGNFPLVATQDIPLEAPENDHETLGPHGAHLSDGFRLAGHQRRHLHGADTLDMAYQIPTEGGAILIDNHYRLFAGHLLLVAR